MNINPVLKRVAPEFTKDWSIGSLIEDIQNLKGNDTLIDDFLDYYYQTLKDHALPIPGDILAYDFQNQNKQFLQSDDDRSCVGFSHIDGEVIVIGDLHGDWTSFLKVLFDADIINKLCEGKLGQFFLLGDYIDRGRCSFELVTSVFILHALFFDKVTPLKGNHEADLNICNEFFDCVDACLTDKGLKDNIVRKFERIFQAIPYFAYVCDVKKFFVHGGIPLVTDKHSLTSFVDLLSSDDNCASYLWSDPCNISEFTGKVILSEKLCFNDVRNIGVKFTQAAIQDFKDNDIIPIEQCIRAHQAFSSFNYANVFGDNSIISLFTTGQVSFQSDKEYQQDCHPYYGVFSSLDFDIALKVLNRKTLMKILSFLIDLKLGALNKYYGLSISYEFGNFLFTINSGDKQSKINSISMPFSLVKAVFPSYERQDEKLDCSFKH